MTPGKSSNQQTQNGTKRLFRSAEQGKKIQECLGQMYIYWISVEIKNPKPKTTEEGGEDEFSEVCCKDLQLLYMMPHCGRMLDWTVVTAAKGTNQVNVAKKILEYHLGPQWR